MSQQPISRSVDLLRLRNEGYNVKIVAGHLVVGDIPYVNAQRQIRRGTLVSTLTLNNNLTGPPDTHVIMFSGERPCRADGAPLSKVINAENVQKIGDALSVQFSFSSKPASGRYDNYYDKVATYAAILTNEAQAIDPSVRPQTFPLIRPDDENSVFLYEDTASSRAGISAATAKLRQHCVVIAGLGGTGSYVLDLIAKTPVTTIRLYDGDVFQQHNAFRSPGAARGEDLQKQPNKAHYWVQQYSAMRRGIVAIPRYLDATNVNELSAGAFVFLCMDGGEKKKPIIRRMEELGISFIDVGMGLQLVDDALTGILRVTASTPALRDHVWERQRIPFTADSTDGIYRNNIQVADLNAINASLAVIKWKKLVGFYRDEVHEHYATYSIDGHALTKEEIP